MNILDTQFGVQTDNSVEGLIMPLKSGEECCEDSNIRMHLTEEENWFLTSGTDLDKEFSLDLCVASELNEESTRPQITEIMVDKSKHQAKFVVTKTLEAFAVESEQAQAGKNDNIDICSDFQSDYEPAIIKTEENCCLFDITAKVNTHGSGNRGSSGKRRHALLQTLLKGAEGATDDDKACKRQRTRWCGDDSQLKMLGPIKLPDLSTNIDEDCLKVDPEMQALNLRLVELNKKLRNLKPVDDLPDEERSPSSPPLYKELAKGMESRKMKYHNQLIEERREIILRLVQKNPAFRPPPTGKPSKFQRKLYIHVLVEADDEGSVDAAVKLVEKLLVPVVGLNHSSIIDPSSEGLAFGASLPSEPSKTKLSDNRQAKNLIVGYDNVHGGDLFVSYLPLSIDDEGLMKMFSPFGKVVHARVARDPITRLSKCYGFVKFSDHSSAAKAAECMNGQNMDGKMLKVKIGGTPKPFLRPKCPGNLSIADKGLHQSSWPSPLGSELLRSSSESHSQCYSSAYTSTKQHKYESQRRDESLQNTLIDP